MIVSLALECVLLGLPVDFYSHVAWMRDPRCRRHRGALCVVEDPLMVVGHPYRIIAEEATNSAGVRATYFIDPEGVIRAIT